MPVPIWRPTSAPRWRVTCGLLIDRSGLAPQEFASRIGVTAEELDGYLDGNTSPTAALMIRIRRLSDRFVKVKSARSAEAN